MGSRGVRMKHRSLRNDPRRRICTSEFTKPLPSGRDGQASIVGNCLTSRSNRSSIYRKWLRTVLEHWAMGLENRGASGLVHALLEIVFRKPISFVLNLFPQKFHTSSYFLLQVKRHVEDWNSAFRTQLAKNAFPCA